MKIRQRLALRFTIVSALIMGAVLILVYVLTRGFVHADFTERLTQQSRLEAIHYGSPHVREVLPSGSFQLVNPSTSIYSIDGKLLSATGSYPIPATWVNFLKDNDVFNAERGEFTTVGRKYQVNEESLIVFVSDKDLPGQHELDILVKAMSFGYIVSLLLSYLAGLYFSGNALAPVKDVVKEVNQITQDNLSYRLKLEKESSKIDEIDELVLTFNALLKRIESAFISQKRFVQHASHELKTPLTAIMAEAELALVRERTTEEYKRTLNVVLLESERLVRTTQGLLTLTRLEEAPFQYEMDRVELKEFGNSTLSIFKLHHPERGVEIERSHNAEYVKGHEELLKMAVLNMLDNAAKYSRGKIIIKIRQEKGAVSIGVQDFGIGIPSNELSRIKSPLFRGSKVQQIQGAGLGLPLVDRIMKVHHGHLEISSEEGIGTYCEISIPAGE